MNELNEEMFIPLEGMATPAVPAPKSMGPTPTAAMKAQLRDIDEKVTDIAAHLGQRDELAVLLADCRTTMTEAAGVIHSMLSDVVLHLQHLDTHQGMALAPGTKAGRLAFLQHSWWLLGAGCVAGLLLMGATWKLWPAPAYQPLLTAIDRTLVAQWGWLPKGTKEDLSAEYKRHGFETPATRKGAQ